MKKTIIGVLLCFYGIATFSQNETEHFTFPGEFENHEAIWMAWKLFPVIAKFKEETSYNVIKALTPYVKINLIVHHDSIIAILNDEFIKRGIDKSKVQMFVYGSNPYRNVRDPGPVFLKSNKGNLMIADMKFNFYGTASSTNASAMLIDTIDHFVARKLNLPVRTSTLVSEGGAREFNGKGTMMAVEYTEMHRNRGWSRDSIENELIRMFGQKKIIWLKQGPAEDDSNKEFDMPSGKVITGGCNHIDEFARFASPNSVLLAEVTKEESLKDPMHKLSYERLEENYRILQLARDQDGNPFNIIRVPVPELIIRTEGAVITTSYLNILITNGLVLMASYWKPGRPEIMKQKDEQVKKIFEKTFPDRKVVAINVEDFNVGGGGIHCATQQQPGRN